jgi:hypothetical protein
MRGVIIGYMHTEAIDTEFEEIPCEYIYVAYSTSGPLYFSKSEQKIRDYVGKSRAKGIKYKKVTVL